ncbi:hypothetical protein KD913_00380 [Klebsiella pneumoniae]
MISQRFVARRLPFAAYEIKAERRNNEGFTVKRELVDVFALKTIFAVIIVAVFTNANVWLCRNNSGD